MAAISKAAILAVPGMVLQVVDLSPAGDFSVGDFSFAAGFASCRAGALPEGAAGAAASFCCAGGIWADAVGDLSRLPLSAGGSACA